MKSVIVGAFMDELGVLAAPAARRQEFAKEASELRKIANTPGFFAQAAENAKADFGGVARDLKTPIRSMKKSLSDNYLNLMEGNKLNKWKAFNAGMLALGTYQGAKAALRKEDPSGKGRSRAERVGRLVGSTSAGLLTLPYTRFGLGIPVNLAGTLAGEAVGSRIGRMLGPRRNPAQAPPLQQIQPQGAAPEAAPPQMSPGPVPTFRPSAFDRYSGPAMQYGGNVTDPAVSAVRRRYASAASNVL